MDTLKQMRDVQDTIATPLDDFDLVIEPFYTHGSLIFIEVFKIYKLLNLLKLEKLFFVGSPIVTTLGGSWAVIMAVYIVLFGLNFGQNRPFFALQKSNFGFAFENERTVRTVSVVARLYWIVITQTLCL